MARILWRGCLAVCLVAAIAAPAVAGQRAVEARHGMVVSVSPEASDAGLSLMRRGGNAVDAAVATAFALAVIFPEAGNIGGGGFMMVYPGSGEPVCVEYRETAPAAATAEMYVDDDRFTGHRVVGVPGTVRGLALAHEKYGSRPWKDVVAPAVVLAEEGFVMDASLAASLNRQTSDHQAFPELARVYGKPGGGQWQAGDRLLLPDLAKTLRRIAEEGPDAFYRGAIAEQMVAEMRSGGGIITRDDLAAYRAVVRTPVHGTFRGYDIYGAPPPSSGGTAIVESLHILERFDLKGYGRFSASTLHLMIEAMRRSYCDRARYLGDPAFTAIPSHLTEKSYAEKLAAGISIERATKSAALAPEIRLAGEGESTTHFSVADAGGMVVANTYTLQASWGSRVVVRGAGFLLNNEMTDFNRRPGHTDTAGASGTPPNVIAPGKRMLSSQSPTLVFRHGRPVLVTGSPGGRSIPNTVLCVLLNVLEFGMDIDDAVDAPRLHQQWFPERTTFEGADDPQHAAAMQTLRSMGHTIDPRRQGDAHSIAIKDGLLIGAPDQRRTSGKAAGY